MVKKSISIPNEIFVRVKDENNFSELVSTLLAEYVRCKDIEEAKSVFGSIPDDGTSSIDKVNSMRAESDRNYLKLGTD